MARSKRKLLKTMKNARKALMLKIEVGDFVYEFEADMFDLDKQNIGILSEQITQIPAMIAFVGEAHGEAEKMLARRQTAFEMWKAPLLTKTDAKSEAAKNNEIMTRKPKEWNEHKEGITEAKKIVAVLKAYMDAMDAKFELSRTLTANIRSERESITGASGSGAAGTIGN